MEYKVKLASLPAGVAFSERLRERCTYNAERGELSYRGFMTKCAYDEISALSDDLDYHRAVEHLFVLTSAEIAPPERSFPLTAAIAGAAAWWSSWSRQFFLACETGKVISSHRLVLRQMPRSRRDRRVFAAVMPGLRRSERPYNLRG